MASNEPGIPLKITIIGSGMAGLSAAIALSDINPNHQITILEANPSLSELGAGLQLFANSTRILHKWGVTPALEKVAFQSSHLSMRRWENNEELSFNMNNPSSTWMYGWPQWQVYRPDLQKVLFDRASQFSNVSILFGKSVKSVDHETGTVHMADGEIVEADLTVAGDGIWSRARRCLPASKDVLPTAYREHNYRATIPRERMLSNPITASFIASPEAKLWVGPDTFVLGYTVASETLYNLVVGVPRASEGVPVGAWNHPADVKAMCEFVSTWCEEVRALASLVQDDCVSWTLGEVPALPSYVSESGRVALVGDAAHAIIPHAAQGAGMAIEDAAALGEFLGHLSSKDDIQKTMGAWSQFRQARVDHLRSISRGTASDMTLPDGEAQVARDLRWNAVRDKQRAQWAELGLEKVKEKMIRERPVADPACKSTLEPGGRMWVNGYDVAEESKKFCREHLGRE